MVLVFLTQIRLMVRENNAQLLLHRDHLDNVIQVQFVALHAHEVFLDDLLPTVLVLLPPSIHLVLSHQLQHDVRHALLLGEQ